MSRCLEITTKIGLAVAGATLVALAQGTPEIAVYLAYFGLALLVGIPFVMLMLRNGN